MNFSMSDFNGYLSLFIACVEILLFVNLIVFAKKNFLNNTAMLIIILLFTYQLFEFFQCSFNILSSFYAYLSFIVISFLPPLILLFVLSMWNKNSKLQFLFFIPAVFFSIFYGTNIDKFEIYNCTPFSVTYNYPLGELYGIFYYLPLIVAMIFLIIKIFGRNDKVKIKLSLVLLISLMITSFPVFLAFGLNFLEIYSLLEVVESVMCKFALSTALGLTFVTLNNPPTEKKLFSLF